MPDDLVLVSHRGPVQLCRESGALHIRRNAGGLVTALSDLVRHVDGIKWICAAATDADRRQAARATWFDAPLGEHSCRVHMLDVDPDIHHDFYGVIANPLLWFVQHSLWDEVSGVPHLGEREQHAWERGYVTVNRAFAASVCDRHEVPTGSTVMVHDYHFYLVPRLVRAQRPDLFVHFFVHIPWPQPDAWQVVPTAWRDAIFRGLLGSDIVAFHTANYANNFLAGCRLLGLDVDLRHSSVRVDGREVAVRHYPISIDVASLEETAAEPETRRFREQLAATRTDHVILRVDRTDPSKNIVRGFLAFDRLLELYPELRGRVMFRALLQPSRQEVPQYADYLRDIERTVVEINARYGSPTWQPIDLQLGDNFPRTIAAYADYDVLMVNPVADGMNLVAKEGLIVNECGGVLVLSEKAGAHDEIGPIAISVDPFNIEQQAHALHSAITMSTVERNGRRRLGAEIVRANDVRKWLERQLCDIELMSGLPTEISPISPRTATR